MLKRILLALTLCVVACGDETKPPACPAGELDCACQPDGSCGFDLVCIDGVCVAKACPAGMQGCACLPDGRCHEGDCAGGVCELPLPDEIVCYTPCQQGYVDADGDLVLCPSDGLMPGCLDAKTCVDGSCVAPGQSAPECVTAAECPDFQTCIQGRCYANCSVDSDCPTARDCYRHVCRLPCTADADSCLQGAACVTVDGDNGFCMPLAPASGESQTQVTGAFSLSTEAIELSSNTLSATLTLTNASSHPVDFTLRKLQHVEYTESGPVIVTANPLHWLHMGAPTPEQVQELAVSVDGNGGTVEIAFANAANEVLPRWDGRIEVVAANVGRQVINLSYVSLPDGQWRGKAYYFGNFGDLGVQAWMESDNKDNPTTLAQVHNAFIKRWGAMRRGLISLDELRAVMTATLTESWKWQSVRDLCASGSGGCTSGAACYLYGNACGYAVYSDSLDASPVPTAVTELPIALNLHAPDPSAPGELEGKIVTSESLQYAGDPAISITFAGDPEACKPGVTSACLAPLSSLDAVIAVGGRYATSAADSACGATEPGTFMQAAVPWLLPGFTAGTQRDPQSSLLYHYECRDMTQPFGAGSPGLNASFAQSNPIPDGRSRLRRLELVDGAMINQQELLIIFRERFEESFLAVASGTPDDEGFYAYGLMMLSRSAADLNASAFQGNQAAETRPQPTGLLDTFCSPALIQKVLGDTTIEDQADAVAMVHGILDGTATSGSPQEITDLDAEKVHYLCHDTGLFDGGPEDTGTDAPKVECPAGSGVTFFTIQRTAPPSSTDQEMMAAEPCQQNGSCQQTLDLWHANDTHQVRLNPVWRCREEDQVYCATNRRDLRVERVFFKDEAGEPVFVPLLTAVDEAFRYKTRFRSRQGSGIGFAPQICVPDSNIIPYCYDPPAIEEIRERVSCGLDLYFNHPLDATTAGRLRSHLETAFGYSQDSSTIPPTVHDGFERLDAELLIMLGDESYTSAFASRFDLAGSSMVSFEGSLFEPSGINLAGAAGFEMYSLYQAAQYYQMVLDRFYSLSPYVWRSVSGLPSQNFIKKETVVAYFDRLIRASTQKSRAWSEVAKRYQGFNRPDLARRVVERAYASAHLESIVLSRLMLEVVAVANPADRAQIIERAELAALGYRAALLDMRDVYQAITDAATFFGYAPDYIPFPAVSPNDANAFVKTLDNAKQSLEVAAAKEVLALESDRSYETDAAMFQAELASIRNNYENQLAELCGTFTGEDGLVHPAIRTYAYLDQLAKLMGDPCGRAGNGRIHDAMVALELAALDMESVATRYDQLFEEVEIERQRVGAQCDAIVELHEYVWKQQGRIMDLQKAIRDSEREAAIAARAKDVATKIGELSKCNVGATTDCPTSAIAIGVVTAAANTFSGIMTGIEIAVGGKEEEIEQIERAIGGWEILQDCKLAVVDSDAKVQTLLLQLKGLDLEALKNQYRMQLAIADLQGLHNKATRLLAEKEETEQQTINIEAARNDPNVRIYKNDAIITADRTFNAALRDAYEATKVFEYYTSQCHERLQDLFLVRMIAHGDYNLEAYLAELEDAYREFEQVYGNPDLRVEILSLRDDILGIPRIDKEGLALSEQARAAALREKLLDVRLLDARGYLTLPFSTSLERTSPLTRNHKIHHMRVELLGTDVGDTLGRIYVAQVGTGTVFGVGGDKTYYRFPERTAVLDPFFNGVRVFEPEVYTNERMRDRPLVNTHWKMIINQKDEHVNQDIDLQSLSDVRLYVYYTDFTQM